MRSFVIPSAARDRNNQRCALLSSRAQRGIGTISDYALFCHPEHSEGSEQSAMRSFVIPSAARDRKIRKL